MALGQSWRAAVQKDCQECSGFQRQWHLKGCTHLERQPGTRITHSERAMKSFLQNTPKPFEWRKRQVQIAPTEKDYENVVRLFYIQDNMYNFENDHNRHSRYPDRLIAIGLDFAARMNQSAQTMKSLCFLQTLVLLSYSMVLQSKGVVIDQILGAVERFGGFTHAKLLSGAAEVNKLIKWLVRTGWPVVRATELFFLKEQVYPALEASFPSLTFLDPATINQSLRQQVQADGNHWAQNTSVTKAVGESQRLDRPGSTKAREHRDASKVCRTPVPSQDNTYERIPAGRFAFAPDRIQQSDLVRRNEQETTSPSALHLDGLASSEIVGPEEAESVSAADLEAVEDCLIYAPSARDGVDNDLPSTCVADMYMGNNETIASLGLFSS
ncbi:MAG: hypothetical protein Q9165_007975 [Trypethelium subeluteriae]